MGAITNENEREAWIPLGFLDDNSTYEVTIYADAPNASWQTNADKYVITKKKLTKKDTIKVKLAKGGGCAISIKKL